jgi:hypothetical protein
MTDNLVSLGDRERLAARQSVLLRALVEDAGTPVGFDRRTWHAQANLLQDKRFRVVQRTGPNLRAFLGDEFRGLFEQYVSEHPQPADTGRAEARAFIDWLRLSFARTTRSPKLTEETPHSPATPAAAGWPDRTSR